MSDNTHAVFGDRLSPRVDEPDGPHTISGDDGATIMGLQKGLLWYAINNQIFNDDTTEKLDALLALIDARNYETVVASQTAQVLGSTGALGDYLHGLLIVPAVVAAGAVSILDGSTSISIFVGGGTSALVDAKPFFVPVGLYSKGGPWKVTTGANVSVIASGTFT